MEWLEVLLMFVLNDEWGVDRRSKFIAGCCGSGMEKGEKKRESCRISEWNSEAFARATRALNEYAQADMNMLERPLFCLGVLERTWVRSSEPDTGHDIDWGRKFGQSIGPNDLDILGNMDAFLDTYMSS